MKRPGGYLNFAVELIANLPGEILDYFAARNVLCAVLARRQIRVCRYDCREIRLRVTLQLFQYFLVCCFHFVWISDTPGTRAPGCLFLLSVRSLHVAAVFQCLTEPGDEQQQGY